MDVIERERLGPLFKELRKSKKMTLEQFYGPIADHVNNFSAIENGSRVIGKRLSKDIINYHMINTEWLKTREGVMFLSKPYLTERQSKQNTSLKKIRDQVPFYDIPLDKVMGLDEGILRDSAKFYIDFKPFNDCDLYLPIYGESMLPKYASGEIIAIKKVTNLDIILWGETYLIFTSPNANQLATLKMVFEHPDPLKVILRASNPSYSGDVIIEKKDIVQLYMIKGKISRNQM